ncbi:MAG: trypsin-like peptidase domain-containing protein [Eubacteriales bacterium]|nr:trypsin-like peptidase domain-containing protein [Eubacteriales bacterium]
MNNHNQDDRNTDNEVQTPQTPENTAPPAERSEYSPPVNYVNTYKPENQIKNPEKKKKKGISRSFVAAAVIIAILLSGAAAFGGTLLADRYTGNPAGTQTENTAKTPADNAGTKVRDEAVIVQSAAPISKSEKIESNAIAAVAAAAADSVVEISTETMVTSSFYGQYITGGAGSGVIITENGYIITCAHVIAGASNVTVKLTDGMEYPATVIGSDALTDIAIVKIEASGLPFATIGDSAGLVVGEDAVAIGNPLGELGGTVTNGIISALDREVEIDGQSYNLLQTNAAINPGNSGGGLFNLNAELIGIVNAKSSGSGIEGLGFAIPVNDAIEIARQLIDFGYIKGRPKLGIMVIDVNEATDFFKLRRQEYAAILNYITGSGVYFLQYNTDIQTEGNFEFGDRIVAMDGIAINNQQSLEKLLNEEYNIGDKVTITVARLTNVAIQRSEMVDVEVTLVESVPAEEEANG